MEKHAKVHWTISVEQFRGADLGCFYRGPKEEEEQIYTVNQKDLF